MLENMYCQTTPSKNTHAHTHILRACRDLLLRHVPPHDNPNSLASHHATPHQQMHRQSKPPSS
ncbi:hypothetical protein BC831DRAFT_447505 [Entophlyctis helioformis]|nr:hypothetical protein BC831DRAFT_447505 [Entophlyctis helioformis]